MQQDECGCLRRRSDAIPFVVTIRFCSAHQVLADRQISRWVGQRSHPSTPMWPYMAALISVTTLLSVVFVFVTFLPLSPHSTR